MKKLISAAAAAALVALAVVPASASIVSSAAEPAAAYGLCVNKSTGLVRALERTALSKSVHGACRKTETKVRVPSVTGLAPARLVYRWPTETWTCPRVNAATTATLWTFSCTSTPVPSPSPSS